jgi:hypothetical protein
MSDLLPPYDTYADENCADREPPTPRKTFCRECGWKGMSSDLIEVFYEVTTQAYGATTITIEVCPDCGECDSTVDPACDEPDCWELVTCGTPTEDGYRNTCGKHAPWRKP